MTARRPSKVNNRRKRSHFTTRNPQRPAPTISPKLVEQEAEQLRAVARLLAAMRLGKKWRAAA